MQVYVKQIIENVEKKVVLHTLMKFKDNFNNHFND